VFVMNGRFGPYVQLGEISDDKKAAKPKRTSLLSTMTEQSVTLDDALRLLSLPREVGKHPSDGEPIVASPGRFGPYIKHGKEFRSLENEERLFTVSLDEAVALLAEPKKSRRRQSAAKTVLRELGPHPKGGAPVNVLAGRYGPYVTDGTTNASLPKGMTPEAVTMEQAVELLAARAGAPKRGRVTRRRAGARATVAK
jgi:DNA topoisomerase-1